MTTLPKPAFNSFYGDLELINKNYALKKPVQGWWKTFKWADEDYKCTLPAGENVTVWFSKKQSMYIICKQEIKNVAFSKNVEVLWIAIFEK